MNKFERGSPNVYADLGRPDADEMLVKAQLAAQISRLIEQSGLTQERAARQLGIPQPRLSNLLRGRFRGISQAKMMECLTRLGRDVRIVVSAAPRARAAGHISVSFTRTRAPATLRVHERAPAYRTAPRKK